MRAPYFILLLVVVMATCATLQRSSAREQRYERRAAALKALADAQGTPSTPIDTTARRRRVPGGAPTFDGSSDAQYSSNHRTQRALRDAKRSADCNARGPVRTRATVGADGAVTESFTTVDCSNVGASVAR